MKETAMWSVPRVALLLVKGVTVKATCVVAQFAFVSAADGAFGEAEAAIQYIPHLPQKL